MLDARDAYLAADMMRFGGANQKELWKVFAQRGMGEFASTADASDVDPIPSFESPLAAEATVTFSATAKEGGAAVAATIYVGRFEAGATPVADTDPSTPLPATVKMHPGTYDFVARGNGFGLFRFTRTLKASATRVAMKLPTNWASSTSGATASGDGGNFGDLIDDTENTNWAVLGRTPNVIGAQVTVDLGGGARVVKVVNVSAMLRPADAEDDYDAQGQNRFTALRQFQIQTCNATVKDCNNPANFTTIYVSAEDAFPAGQPRPLAPNLIFKTFVVPQTTATHVRLVVLDNQCTGGPAFQGDQDNDPVNNSDCQTGSDQDLSVRAAELQVFSSTGSAG
jgi:hypothetical protein